MTKNLNSPTVAMSMDDDLYQRLLNSAFRFLSIRNRSEKEIRDFLAKKLHAWHEASSEESARVIDRLKEMEYIDDSKFASWWIAARSGRNAKGARVIKAELRAKGVKEDIIEDLLGGVSYGQQSEEGARKLVERKSRLLSHLPLTQRRKRLGNLLVRRGFEWGLATRIIDEIVGKSYNTDSFGD